MDSQKLYAMVGEKLLKELPPEQMNEIVQILNDAGAMHLSDGFTSVAIIANTVRSRLGKRN